MFSAKGIQISSIAVALSLALMLLAPAIAFAQIPTLVPCTGATGDDPCKLCHIAELAQNTLNAGIYIAVFLSAILFAWAGFKYITAGGDPGGASEAKKIFWNVGIGLVLMLTAWLVVDFIMKMLVSESVLIGPWNKIC
jgi:hypothetical protein